MQRSGQQHLLDYRNMAAATAAAPSPPSPAPPAPPAGQQQQQQQQQQLPTWWLLVIASWVPPQSVFWSLVLSILMPVEVKRLVGDERKTIYLGYISTLTSLGSLWGPCLGAWSDRCRSPLGRRRPFMLVGALLFIVALVVLSVATTFWVYAAGMFLFTFTACINCTPYNSILPEIVPESQRATAASISTWVGTIFGQASAALGVAVGEGKLTTRDIYGMSGAVSVFFALPMGLLIVGGRPGCCTPEIPPTPRADGGDTGACELARLGLRDFLSGFRYRPFLWMSVILCLQTVWLNLQSLFYLCAARPLHCMLSIHSTPRLASPPMPMPATTACSNPTYCTYARHCVGAWHCVRVRVRVHAPQLLV